MNFSIPRAGARGVEPTGRPSLWLTPNPFPAVQLEVERRKKFSAMDGCTGGARERDRGVAKQLQTII
jgi:hypothetical protein